MISIIITTNDNDYKLVSNLIEQVNDKILIPHEIIIMDNRELYKNDAVNWNNTVVYSFGYNAFQFTARYKAISLAKGEYIWFIDADDEVMSIDKISANDDMIVFNYDYYPNGTQNIYNNHYENPELNISNMLRFSYGLWNKFIKTEILKPWLSKITPFKSHTFEDGFWSAIALYSAHSVYTCDKIIYRHNKGTTNSDELNRSQWECMLTGWSEITDLTFKLFPKAFAWEVINNQTEYHCKFYERLLVNHKINEAKEFILRLASSTDKEMIRNGLKKVNCNTSESYNVTSHALDKLYGEHFLDNKIISKYIDNDEVERTLEEWSNIVFDDDDVWKYKLSIIVYGNKKVDTKNIHVDYEIIYTEDWNEVNPTGDYVWIINDNDTIVDVPTVINLESIDDIIVFNNNSILDYSGRLLKRELYLRPISCIWMKLDKFNELKSDLINCPSPFYQDLVASAKFFRYNNINEMNNRLLNIGYIDNLWSNFEDSKKWFDSAYPEFDNYVIVKAMYLLYEGRSKEEIGRYVKDVDYAYDSIYRTTNSPDMIPCMNTTLNIIIQDDGSMIRFSKCCHIMDETVDWIPIKRYLTEVSKGKYDYLNSISRCVPQGHRYVTPGMKHGLCAGNKWCDFNRYPLDSVVVREFSCNLKCKMCRNDHYLSKEGLDSYFKVLDSVKGLKLNLLEVTSSGEPFLQKKRFMNYLEGLTPESDFKKIKIITNATLIDEDDIRRLKEISDKTGIIYDIYVSCDGISEDTYKKIRGVNLFNKVRDNIALLKKLGLLWKLHVVLCEDNLSELPYLPEYWEQYGVEHKDIIILECESYYENENNHNDNKVVVNSDEYKEFKEKYPDIEMQNYAETGWWWRQ